MSEEKKKPLVDLDSISEEKMEQLNKKIGEFITDKLKQPLLDVQKMLDNYGLQFHMMWEITKADVKPMWENPVWYKEKLEKFLKDVKDHQKDSTESPKTEKKAKPSKPKKKTAKKAAKKKAAKKTKKAVAEG